MNTALARFSRAATVATVVVACVLVAACGRTAEQAKAELERAGLAVNPEMFVGLAGHYPAHVIALYLDAGIDVNVTGGLHRTSALMNAAAGGRVDNIKLLLKRGASVRMRDGFGQTALYWAARHCRNVEALTLLMDAGADPKVRDDLNQSILFAMLPQPPNTALPDKECSADVLALLMRSGVVVDERASNGETALNRAIRLRDRQMTKLLLAAGANVNFVDSSNGASPLHAAAYQGDEALVRALLAAGADPNRRTTDGYRQSPLRLARTPGAKQAILEAGGNDD